MGLRVSDLARSTAYWCGLNGMTTFPGAAPVSDVAEFPMATVGYDEGQVMTFLVIT